MKSFIEQINSTGKKALKEILLNVRSKSAETGCKEFIIWDESTEDRLNIAIEDMPEFMQFEPTKQYVNITKLRLNENSILAIGTGKDDGGEYSEDVSLLSPYEICHVADYLSNHPL